MANGEFLNEYRRDVAAFLKTPGGKYYFQALIAKEVEYTVQAAKADTIDQQVKYVNKFAGMNEARDMLQRFGEPKIDKKRG